MAAVICMLARSGGPLSGTGAGAATCVFGVFCVWTLGQRAQWPRRARAVPRRIVPRWPEPWCCSGMCFPSIGPLFLSLAVLISVIFYHYFSAFRQLATCFLRQYCHLSPSATPWQRAYLGCYQHYYMYDFVGVVRAYQRFFAADCVFPRFSSDRVHRGQCLTADLSMTIF